jgi:hypothetical protein
MIKKNSDSIQTIQELLKRTHNGRIIDKQIDNSNENIEGYGKTECQLCGLILTSDQFVSGCLQCGSTEFNAIT